MKLDNVNSKVYLSEKKKERVLEVRRPAPPMAYRQLCIIPPLPHKLGWCLRAYIVF